MVSVVIVFEPVADQCRIGVGTFGGRKGIVGGWDARREENAEGQPKYKTERILHGFKIAKEPGVITSSRNQLGAIKAGVAVDVAAASDDFQFAGLSSKLSTMTGSMSFR